MAKIRFTSFPRTEPPPDFVRKILAVFFQHEAAISTEVRETHLKSNEVLSMVAVDLVSIGFAVEQGQRKEQKISRPVFFGEDGLPTLRLEVDAYHAGWRCGLEVEATRAVRGGAFYRDLVQALVMVHVEHLLVAIPNFIQWGKGNKSRPYEECCRTADALFGHSRIQFPYGLTILGY